LSSSGDEVAAKMCNRRQQTILAVADILSVNVFFLLFNFSHEVFFAHIPIEASLRLRAVALITNTLTARPFGLWLDVVRRKVSRNKLKFARNYLADTMAFATFQLPIYWLNMGIARDVSLDMAMRASFTVLIMAGLLGRPCGAFMSFIRSRIKSNSAGITTETGGSSC
jgi:L-alanine exporter